MSEVPLSEKFKGLLREKLIALGMAASAAENIAQKIAPVRKKDALVIAQCSDAFHRNLFAGKMMEQIIEVAKSCWGPETEFVFEQESSLSVSKNIAPPTSRRKRTSSFVKQEQNIFSYETEAQVDSMPRSNPADSPISEDPRSDASANSIVMGSEPSDRQALHRLGAVTRQNSSLQPDFVFDTFVRGQSNMVAYSACEAVANNPGLLSNPVFIYGSTGLGKTHLLHSVGNEILDNHPTWKVVYVSSQDFLNDVITSIRFQKTTEFRNKYHSADVLLVDDIQFLESKESTQMEFFHVFNVLCEKKKQIVITSDKYPKDIPNIEVRLKSRFLQGLIADIEPPSLEDRIAIIEAKTKMMKLELSSEIIMHIATHVRSNVRELQGLLTNLLMGQSMTGKAPTMEATNEVLRRIVHMQGPSIDIATIQKVVASHFGLKVSDLTSPKREKKLVLPRHIAMYLTKDLLNIALTEIAENFHRGDHTTVQHAIKKVTNLMTEDESTRASVRELRRKLEHSI